jgi:hypothetical protein
VEGAAGPLTENTVRRRKTPRVQRNAFLFAGVRVRRPFPSGNRSGGSEGATVTAVTKTPGLFGPGAPSGAGALRLSIEADHGQATRGVRGKHGLGQSSRASDRGGRSQCEAIVIASAPGPTNLGWLTFWPGGSGNRVVADAAIRSSSPIPKGARLGRTSCVTGDRDAVLRSSNEPQSCSWIVSIAEVDERRVAPRTLE